MQLWRVGDAGVRADEVQGRCHWGCGVETGQRAGGGEGGRVARTADTDPELAEGHWCKGQDLEMDL